MSWLTDAHPVIPSDLARNAARGPINATFGRENKMPQLPSGLNLYISKLSVIDFQGRTDWFRCPQGHFWVMTPNLSVSPPPYAPRTEIAIDFLSAPVPQTRQEAAQFVHVYLEDPVHQGNRIRELRYTFRQGIM